MYQFIFVHFFDYTQKIFVDADMISYNPGCDQESKTDKYQQIVKIGITFLKILKRCSTSCMPTYAYIYCSFSSPSYVTLQSSTFNMKFNKLFILFLF